NVYTDGIFFFSSRRRHTRSKRDWSSDVCSSDLRGGVLGSVSRRCHSGARGRQDSRTRGGAVPGSGAGSRPCRWGERGRGRRKSRIIPGVSAAGARNRYAVHRSTTLLPGAVAPVLSFDHCEGVATVQFHLDRGVLGDAVSWATRTLPVRPAMPILQGVRIIADAGGELQLSTFDYEVSAQIRLEAEVEQSGEVLVQGRMLSDIVRALPNKDVSVALEGTKLQVRCGSARFALATLPVEEYP